MTAFALPMVMIYWVTLWGAFWGHLAQEQAKRDTPLTIQLGLQATANAPGKLFWSADGLLQDYAAGCEVDMTITFVQVLNPPLGEVVFSTVIMQMASTAAQMKFDSGRILVTRPPVTGDSYFARVELKYTEPGKPEKKFSARSSTFTFP